MIKPERDTLELGELGKVTVCALIDSFEGESEFTLVQSTDYSKKIKGYRHSLFPRIRDKEVYYKRTKYFIYANDQFCPVYLLEDLVEPVSLTETTRFTAFGEDIDGNIRHEIITLSAGEIQSEGKIRWKRLFPPHEAPKELKAKVRKYLKENKLSW